MNNALEELVSRLKDKSHAFNEGFAFVTRDKMDMSRRDAFKACPFDDGGQSYEWHLGFVYACLLWHFIDDNELEESA